MRTPGLRAVLVTALFVASLGLCACASEPAGEGSAEKPEPARDGPVFAEGGFDAVTEPSRKPPVATGPAFEVIWEALAREKYLLENSRFRRRGPLPPQKIVLLNASHPDAKSVASGRGGEKGAHSAIIPDRDMADFIKGLEKRGFFKYARPAGYDAAIAGSSSARGRVTVIRRGDGRSIISMRGQGQNANTKEIPRIYSEAKQAIMALRNMHPTLSVTRSGASGNAALR